MLSKVMSIFSFDRLIGPPLVTVIYYFGLVAIIGGALISILLAMMGFATDIGGAVMKLLAVPAVAAVVLALWRFFCELCMLAFANHEMLRDIRDAQQRNYPQF